MLEILYFGVGFVCASSFLFEGRGSPLLIRLTLAFIVVVAWPYFVVALLLGNYIRGRQRKTHGEKVDVGDDKVIFACEGCGQKLRIPTGRLMRIRCPSCKKEWQALY
jgi:hypothetical protein